MILWGWVLAEQGQREEGVTYIQQGLAAYRATGAALHLRWLLAPLAKTHGNRGQIEAGSPYWPRRSLRP